MNSPALPRRLVALSLLGALALHAPLAFAADSARPAAPAVSAAVLAPVPIPAAVTIARPSPAEIAQANAVMAKFLAQADAPTKSLVAKYPDLISVRPPRVNPCVVPALNPGFRTKHANNVAVAQAGDIDVLFMGDSITDFWRNAGKEGDPNPPLAGKKIFDQYYGAMKVANFGISGDTTQGVLYRLRDGEGQGFSPKAIMLMIGTNNAATASSAEIAEGVGAVVQELRTDFPSAKILLLAIFPRGVPGDPGRTIVSAVNPIIAKLHDGKNVFYLDIGAKFLDATGNLPADIMPDRLHPTEKGYAIWAEAVKEPLAELMK